MAGENKKKRAARQKAYGDRPTQRKRNAARKRARRKVVKARGAAAMEGKDVHHKDGNPKNNDNSNLKVVSIKKNRSTGNNK
jgi:hypothetical protein